MLVVVTSAMDVNSLELDVQHVLVPLDGSELALQALPTARVLSERLGAQLHSISVASADDDAQRLRALASAALGVETGNTDPT